MLAHVGAGLDTVRLPGRCCVPASLHARPATPVAGEAGGRGESSCNTPRLKPSTPGQGEAWEGGEEVRAGDGVGDLLGCWTSLLPPPPRLGGGCSGPGWCLGATPRYRRRGPHTMVVSSELTWWLAANWWYYCKQSMDMCT
jgi:hypothetical protein